MNKTQNTINQQDKWNENSKTVAIMQPTFLPWLGYFDLMDQVDTFIFLDNVQFEKQSWQQRNKIRTSNGLVWLTIPVYINGRFGQNICDVEIEKNHFPHKQIKTLQHNYSKAKYFTEYWPKFEEVFRSDENLNSLSLTNIKLIKFISELLGIKTKTEMASNISKTQGRSDRLIELIHNTGSKNYISPKGSKDYLEKDAGKFYKAEISIFFHKFLPPTYNQLYHPFLEGASVIDILFNYGADWTIKSIRSNRLPPKKFIPSAGKGENYEY